MSGSATGRNVFGDDAHEFFHAWAVAHIFSKWPGCKRVSAALNVRQRGSARPLRSGCLSFLRKRGGATYNVIPIWKATAPAIDLLSADIYINDAAKYLKVLTSITGPTTRCWRRQVNCAEVCGFSSRPLGGKRLDSLLLASITPATPTALLGRAVSIKNH